MKQSFPVLIFVGIVQCSVCQQETCDAVLYIQLGNHVKNPGVVGIGSAGNRVAMPPGIVRQLVFATPAFEVEPCGFAMM